MGKNTSFTLGDHFSEFVDDCVHSGRYNTVSDVVRAGLRLLEAEEAKLEALRSALIEGEQSGPSRPFDFRDYVSRKRNRTA
ncbi:MAG: type II toxin-antitoxin system ParD family antitoxin [Paraburkholderia sp.]|uniref:type II toxin-antitoxin system ParD family antitoxin n=1 Tax=Paraburkholderia sp. TaxID=1926495 RepID=UPI001223D81E|nr:type II toxin-antitoxin system ParD family antitoxin [Paraburkholderia sp.]TAL93792.1 MAG: type II toxin-antitoxin system ParD family antitoxin [Paraburkholderia sp.]